MPILVFRPAARHELAKIAADVARASSDPETGRRFARRLDGHCRRLASLPGLLVHRTKQMVHHLFGASRCTAHQLVGRLVQTDESSVWVGPLGRPRPEFGRDYRTSAYEGHLVVFRYADLLGPRSHFIVIHILSGRRDLGTLFAEPEIDR